jgi:hypothetical protein
MVGLSSSTRFVRANALALPFPDASCDAAWTERVQMNVADKHGFYAEAARVLRHGGKLILSDIFRVPLTSRMPRASSSSCAAPLIRRCELVSSALASRAGRAGSSVPTCADAAASAQRPAGCGATCSTGTGSATCSRAFTELATGVAAAARECTIFVAWQAAAARWRTSRIARGSSAATVSCKPRTTRPRVAMRRGVQGSSLIPNCAKRRSYLRKIESPSRWSRTALATSSATATAPDGEKWVWSSQKNSPTGPLVLALTSPPGIGQKPRAL